MIAPASEFAGVSSYVPHEVAALLNALHVSKGDTALLKTLSDREWSSLLTFSDLAHLTLPLAQLPMNGLPDWVVQRLKANVTDNALRFERVKATYREAARAMDKAAVPHIVIKGFTQAPEYVHAPRLRGQSDIDLYLPDEMIATAKSALESIGYQAQGGIDFSHADHTPTMVRLRDWKWRGNPYDPEMPLSIELHFCLWNDSVSLFSIPGVQEFWNRRTTRKIEGISVPCLNPVDHLGYLSLHILRNVFGRDWVVHHVRELAEFLHAHASDDAFWKAWGETHDSGLRSAEAIAFYYARTWFGCDLHQAAEREIASLPPGQRQWLDHFAGSALEIMFRPNKDAVWLNLTFLNSRGAKLSLLRRTFIPLHVPKISSPARGLKNRQAKRSRQTHPLLAYIIYLFSRTASFSLLNISTLFRGARWYLLRHELLPQFWIFLAASFFFDLGLSIYFFLFNLFLLGHGYTEKTLGLLTSALAVGNLVGALPAGRLAQRIGLRPVLLGSFVLAIVASSSRALLLSFPWQISLAFLAGTALSAWAVCLSPAVAQLTNEKQRPLAFSLIFSLGIGLGAVGGFAGSRLPGWIASHQLKLLGLQPIQVILLLSCCIVALGIWPASRLSFVRLNKQQRARPLFSPNLARFLPAIAVWSLVTGSFSPLASVYFSRHLHMSLPQIGSAFSLSQIAQVCAVLVAPFLFRRWGLIHGVVATQLAASLLLLILASVGHPAAAASIYIAFTACQWMNEPGLYSLLMNIVPAEDRPGASASNSLTMSASQAIAATLFGAAFARFGYPAILRCIAVLGFVAAALCWNIQREPKRHSSLALDDVRRLAPHP